MDPEVELHCQKKQKEVRECEISDNEDVINGLPDNLLAHILSLIPTKDAVRTCIVSIRWKELWKSTTSLDFDWYSRTYDKKEGKFVHKQDQFIDRVLLSHSSNITRFYLYDLDNDFDSTHLQSWISDAVQRRVQEVHLSIFKHPQLLFPSCFYTSKVLRVLKVYSLCTLQVPPMFSLSSLKILRLENVKFLDDISFNRLSPGLPVLEELTLCFCNWDSIRNATISLPNLRSLSLSVRNISCYVVNGDLTIKVNAQNLTCLNYEGTRVESLLLENTPLLTNASIRLRLAAPRQAFTLFNALGRVKSLKITEESLRVLYDCCCEENINLFPTFVSLKALELDLSVTSYSGEVLMDILRSAPVLESIVIKELSGSKWCKEPYPQCICLRRFSLLKFNGSPRSITLVEFVMKAGIELERLNLYCTPSLWERQEKLKEAKSRLAMSAIASKHCVIKYLQPYRFPPKIYLSGSHIFST